jgi:hypothetical protein
MEGFHATVHHFGEPGDLGYADDGETGLLQGPGGPAGRYQLETTPGKSAGKVDQAGFVGNTD